jgi:hypothetical protein
LNIEILDSLVVLFLPLPSFPDLGREAAEMFVKLKRLPDPESLLIM